MSRVFNLLDLSIILTPPPLGAPARVIASIALRCEKLGLSHTGDFLTDPLTANERKKLSWYLEEYWEQFYEKRFAQRGRKVEDLLPELGIRLYKQVFGSAEAASILSKWLGRPAKQYQINVISDIPRVLSLPWELLHHDDFLALRHQISVVRCLPQSEHRSSSNSFELPLRVLLVTARPEGVGFVDPRIIARELLDQMQEHIEAGDIVVEFLRPPTLEALGQRLSNSKLPPVHVLHFDGHGEYDKKKKLGELFFEKKDGRTDPVTSKDIAQILHGSSIHLVVMTSCQNTVGSKINIFSSVATGLIKSGVDAVAGMSASILVPSAVRYTEAFYRALIDDPSGLVAQWQARRTLYTDKERYLLRGRRGQEGVRIELQDWWVPHYYQRRPLMFQLRPSIISERGRNPLVPDGISGSLPDEPRYGFSGRSRELLQIERYLMQKKLVVVHGFAGVGKTALVSEVAYWLIRTRMYAALYFVDLAGDGRIALRILENLNQGLEARPAETKPLVVVDSLEGVLPGGDYPLESIERSKLWYMLLSLAHKGAGVVLTSSDTTVGEGRLEPGEKVAHLSLGGLRAWDAYALATQVLKNAGMDSKRVSPPELYDFLDYLDYHPLAIQLVLPLLREQSLSEVKSNLAKFLPNCVDGNTQGRHRSLMDLLGSTLRRLSRAEVAMLHRLVFFEGGVCEDTLLKVTAFSHDEWSALRESLERVELLMIEQVHQAITARFIHFHPALAPYLRGQSGSGDEELRKRYIQRYYALAEDLYQTDKRCMDHVLALVRRELPNLKHALELLLRAGDLDRALEMAKSICWFLNKFGRLWEHDALQQRVAKATSAAKTQVDVTI